MAPNSGSRVIALLPALDFLVFEFGFRADDALPDTLTLFELTPALQSSQDTLLCSTVKEMEV